MSSIRPAKLPRERILVRRVEPDDAAAMLQIMSGTAAYSGTMQLPYVSEQIWRERLVKIGDGRIVLLASLDGMPIGHVALILEENLRRRHAANLGIAVADEFVGRGVGSILLQEAVNLADNWLQVLRIELTVFLDNANAIALYQKFGFVQEGIFRAYAMRDGQLQDVASMARLHPRQALLPASAATTTSTTSSS